MLDCCYIRTVTYLLHHYRVAAMNECMNVLFFLLLAYAFNGNLFSLLTLNLCDIDKYEANKFICVHETNDNNGKKILWWY